MASRRKRKAEGKGVDPNGWLLTYSDMITLLMCFFVIFFNPDDITQEQLEAIVAGMRPVEMLCHAPDDLAAGRVRQQSEFLQGRVPVEIDLRRRDRDQYDALGLFFGFVHGGGWHNFILCFYPL